MNMLQYSPTQIGSVSLPSTSASLQSSRAPQLRRYLIVVPVRFKRLGGRRFATESPFAEHLKQLLKTLDPGATIRVLAPEMSPETYKNRLNYLCELDPEQDHIEYEPLYPEGPGKLDFAIRSGTVFAKLLKHVRWSEVVHSGTSHNLFEPIEIAAISIGVALGRKTIAIADIDLRKEAEMSYQTGTFSRRGYLLSKYLYDPIRNAQLSFAARWCTLALYKGQEMVTDFGQGRSSVKYFLDSAYSQEHIISEERLQTKIGAVTDPQKPLELVYFGRLVAYKGVDRTLHAVAEAKKAGASIKYDIIGFGEEEQKLKALSKSLGIDDIVHFSGAVTFGPELFERLYQKDLLLAAPLSEDTPRSALDAFASGIAVLGFDIYYYQTLKKLSGAAEVVPWPNVQAMAKRIVYYDQHRDALARLMQAGPIFAQENTQEKWLARRNQWTRELSTM